jgi:hypothetical protein
VIIQSEPDLSQSFEPLRERVAETVSWGLRRSEAGIFAEALRTVAFAPPPATAWIDTVRTVAESRLLRLGRSWRRTLDPLGGGALLLYYPGGQRRTEVTTASDGFFDARETPPWDIWSAFIEEAETAYLLTWIPPWAHAQAAAGVAASGGALHWLEESEVELRAVVRGWAGSTDGIR